MPALVPIFGTSYVASIGNDAQLRLYFGEVVTGVETAGWTLKYNGVTIPTYDLSESEAFPPAYFLWAARAPRLGEVPTLTYTGGVFDLESVEMAGFTDEPVQNNGTVAADEVTLAAILAAVQALPSATDIATIIAGRTNIKVVSPITYSTLDIIKGDSWAALPRVFDFTMVSGEYWPTTLSTVDFTATPNAATLAADPNAASLTQVAGTVVTPTGDSRKVRITLTAAQTATLSAAGANGYNWWIVANRATAPATLRTGTMTVREGT